MHYLLLIVLVSFAALPAKAQYDPSFSHYWAMEPSFNPAAVGKESKLNVTAAYNHGFTGFENNPRTMYAGADMPFFFIGAYHGAGVQFLNDQIGLFHHTRFALQYAYKFKLFGGRLSVGVQPSLLSEKFNGSSGLDLADSSDPAFTSSDLNGTAFDLAAGLFYTHRQWYAGASVQHALAPLVELGEKNEIQLDRTYYLTGGYNIRLRNPFLTIHPSLLARTDLTAWRVDVSGRLKYTNDKKVMYLGASYSPKTSVTVFVGGNFHGISLGYSYEMYTSAVSVGNGSHELCIGYQTDLNLYKKGRNKHKSVRFL